MKIKISNLDKKFSHFIRWIRDKGVCQYCHKQFNEPARNLHCSHFHGRRKKSVRYEPDNVIAACFSCHQYLGENPVQHYEFFMRRLGEKRFNMLNLAANTPRKPDYKMIEIWLDAEIKKASQEIIGGKP